VAQDRLVVLGIDGVPFSLLSELTERVQLPNFKRLREQTGLVQMDSVHPTVSSAAWTSYVTGSQPGKHGIFGFIDRKPGSYQMTIPLANSVSAGTIWQVLSDAGKRVFGMNVPVSYPPRAVNGILIGGFLCPSIEKVASPAELVPYLKSIDYQIDTDPALARRSTDEMLPNIDKTLDARMEAMFHFLRQERWDYFHTHVMATDRLNHFLLARYQAGDLRYAEAFLAFYRKLDGYLGRLLDTLPDDCGLLVLSDHGFCPIKSEVQLSRYLIERGWCSVLGQPRHPLDIEPSGTRAFTLIPGRLYLNVKGREPAGVVEPDDYGRTRDELAQDLLALRAPSGEPVIRKVFRREEIYWPAGESAAQPERGAAALLAADGAFGRAPDLVAIPYDGYDLKMGLVAPETFVRTELEGMHTYDDALVMARGVELPAGRFSIVELTRCVLNALGVQVPADMD